MSEDTKSPMDDFFESEENQKKYGFTYDKKNNAIYCDEGDWDEIFAAMMGRNSVEEMYPEVEGPEYELKLSDDGLVGRQKGTDNEFREVVLQLYSDQGDTPAMELIDADGNIICGLTLLYASYYPSKEACALRLGIRALTALNQYLAVDKWETMCVEWFRIHLDRTPDSPIAMPNYRYLASH